MFKKSGFTLIELVIVIILLGILAATAIPKLIGNDGFEAQAYRDQLLQLLKTVQQQAMSCDDDCRKNVGGIPRTNNLYACNKVIIESNRFGIPKGCDVTFPLAGYEVPQLGMSKAEADSSSISFNSPLRIIEFDSRGVANGCVSCDISIIGEQTLFIRIESQGYIHEQ
ncbi:type II secretion system protein [Moritella dasanensis]|uniref:type II secretion system protein n=1 Tax=Moritella dasanensis TaxID=428031 RepID=UPI0002DB9612|nr:type II secretion system protein [Moritella dasanensis]